MRKVDTMGGTADGQRSAHPAAKKPRDWMFILSMSTLAISLLAAIVLFVVFIVLDIGDAEYTGGGGTEESATLSFEAR
eukprot:1067998-Pleurochrysis_carterae.AAC.1